MWCTRRKVSPPPLRNMTCRLTGDQTQNRRYWIRWKQALSISPRANNNPVTSIQLRLPLTARLRTCQSRPFKSTVRPEHPSACSTDVTSAGPIEPNRPLGGWDDPNEVRTHANVNSPLPRAVQPTPVIAKVEESQSSTGQVVCVLYLLHMLTCQLQRKRKEVSGRADATYGSARSALDRRVESVCAHVPERVTRFACCLWHFSWKISV